MNFSLYRGNLHKVPDVPWRWPLPKPTISLRVFKKAIAKRQQALLRIRADPHSEGELQPDDALVDGELGSTPSLHDENDGQERSSERKKEDFESFRVDGDAMAFDENLPRGRGSETEKGHLEGKSTKDMDCGLVPCDVSVKEKQEDANGAVYTNGVKGGIETMGVPGGTKRDKDVDRLEAPRTPIAKDEEFIKPKEWTREPDGCDFGESSAAKRKAELQEKLKLLQETKHQLVQILKQVLINEESKERTHGLPPYAVPYATIGANDSPLDQKLGGDLQSMELEEGELEYASNTFQPAAVASGYGAHFSHVTPQTLGANLGRHYSSSQQMDKP